MKLLILLIFFCGSVHSANILVTVVGIAGSQNLIMYRLAELMGERGHNVTVLKGELLPETKSIKLKYAKEISYSLGFDEEALAFTRAQMLSMPWSATNNKSMGGLQKMFHFLPTALKMFKQIRVSCERLLENQEFIQKLNDSKFDVVIIHIVDLCTFGLTQVLNIDAYVWMTTAMLVDPMAWYSGSPLAQSYVPTVSPPSRPGPLSTLDRLKNTVASVFMLGLFQYGMVQPYTEVFRNRYGPDFPHYDQILKKTQLYFVNVDPMFEYARPVSPNVINVGGLTMKKAEPLNREWQKLLDDAPEEGVVVFSLGSITNTTLMPQSIKLSFLNAFKRFPHLFIWRFDGPFPEAKSARNVHLSHWLPQKDLMAHPKVKAAIIHGGYNSLTETTYMGVPVVVLPLWGDQFGNAIRVISHNIGVRIDQETLNEEEVHNALKKVLYDKTIQENAKLLGRMIREKPFSSMQQATEWLEYLGKFKRLDQLQPQSHDLYWFQYFLLDILLIILGVLLTAVALIALIIKICCRLCCKTKKEKKKRE